MSESELPKLPDEERSRTERKILEAAWAPLSKLALADQDLTSKAIAVALSESAVAADAAFDEARARLRGDYGFIYIDTETIVCTAYAAWCAGADDVADYAPLSIAGSRLAAFAMFVMLSRALRDVRDAAEDISDEELSFRGARDISGIKEWADENDS